MRIGILGGSFDPIHRGHLTVAAAAADQLPLDTVLFVPARTQPFKRERHHADAHDRATMVRLAIAVDPRFRLDGRELARPGPSYTVETLRALRAEYPDDELFLLIGADAARDFPQWHEVATISDLAQVVVLTRPGFDARLAGARTLPVPAVDISATMVREQARRGQSLRRLVPPAVEEYIQRRQLYRAAPTHTTERDAC